MIPSEVVAIRDILTTKQGMSESAAQILAFELIKGLRDYGYQVVQDNDDEEIPF